MSQLCIVKLIRMRDSIRPTQSKVHTHLPDGRRVEGRRAALRGGIRVRQRAARVAQLQPRARAVCQQQVAAVRHAQLERFTVAVTGRLQVAMACLQATQCATCGLEHG